jgi:hypothetical protein
MPLPRHILEEQARQRAAEHEVAQRDTLWDHVRTALTCVFWAALGIALLGLSFHTTDLALGNAAFAAGLGIGNGGIIFTLLAAYRRGEKRGDW